MIRHFEIMPCPGFHRNENDRVVPTYPANPINAVVMTIGHKLKVRCPYLGSDYFAKPCSRIWMDKTKQRQSISCPYHDK
jgi:uncharacterized Zn-finger protein